MADLKVALIDPNTRTRQRLAIQLAKLEGMRLASSTDSLVSAVARHAELRFPPDLVILRAEERSWDFPSEWVLLRALLPNSRCMAIIPPHRNRTLQWGFIYGCALVEDDKELVAWVRRRTSGLSVVALSNGIASRLRRILVFPAADVAEAGGSSLGRNVVEAVSLRGRVNLSALERKVLSVLADRSPMPVTVEDLLRLAWSSPKEAGGTGDQVYGCIRRLRRKIERDARRPQIVRTVRGQGYCLGCGVNKRED